MDDLSRLNGSFDPRGCYSWELDRKDVPSLDSISGFDKHGYRLTSLEAEYAFINGRPGIDRYHQSYRDARQG